MTNNVLLALEVLEQAIYFYDGISYEDKPEIHIIHKDFIQQFVKFLADIKQTGTDKDGRIFYTQDEYYTRKTMFTYAKDFEKFVSCIRFLIFYNGLPSVYDNCSKQLKKILKKHTKMLKRKYSNDQLFNYLN
jgi:hypothetical protein